MSAVPSGLESSITRMEVFKGKAFDFGDEFFDVLRFAVRGKNYAYL